MKAENLTKANKIQKSIHKLECLEKAIISKEGNRFAYLKELQSNGFFGWEIEDEELTSYDYADRVEGGKNILLYWKFCR